MVEWQDMLGDVLSVSLSPDTCRCYAGASEKKKRKLQIVHLHEETQLHGTCD